VILAVAGYNGYVLYPRFDLPAVSDTGLLVLAAAAVGTAQQRVVTTVQADAAQVKRWGGVVLILVGLWTIALALWPEEFARLFSV
jgi:hypothetical protein